ncbi:MAG: hypothetical protein ACUVTG_08055 [Candidatus Oleimicrobiaceae bacterium]
MGGKVYPDWGGGPFPERSAMVSRCPCGSFPGDVNPDEVVGGFTEEILSAREGFRFAEFLLGEATDRLQVAL